MKIVSNLYEFLSTVEQKKDILKNVRIQMLMGTIDFHNIFVPTMEVNGAHQLFKYIRQRVQS